MTKEVRFNYEKATAKLVMWDESNATVSNVFSINRGKGHGTRLMQMIVNYADEKGLDLVLEAQPYGYADKMSPNTAGLRAWYVKFGFQHVGENMMQRKTRKLHGS
jgi:GNAT superfamily N-acetyltransferase